MFLMHRVELKVACSNRFSNFTMVPNAPCGVESVLILGLVKAVVEVPNAPCGVESKDCPIGQGVILPVPNAPCGVERNFMLYIKRQPSKVPNAPCGVESMAGFHLLL